jgi:hypothetical protein
MPSHGRTAMDDQRKYAYRYVIYWAMLEIRMLRWQASRPLRLLNPVALYRVWRNALRAGAIAEWLHNAAYFSTVDFEGFREDWFWNEHDRLVKEFGDGWNYRSVFESRLTEPGDPAGDT